MLILVCGLWAVPLLALFVDSFRNPYTAARSGWWTALADPGSLTLANYRDALDARGLSRAFVNSLVLTIPAVTGAVTVSATTAFALARFGARRRGLATAVLLVLAVVPIQVVLVPVLRLYNGAGLAGTYPGIWMLHVGMSLPFGTYLLRNFFATLPHEITQAAEIDGATPLQEFVRITLPLSRSALASVAIFQFIWIWNDLLLALVFLGGEPAVAPLTVTIANMVNATTGQGGQQLAAAAFVAMSLPLVVFFALQRHFVSGLLAGAVK